MNILKHLSAALPQCITLVVALLTRLKFIPEPRGIRVTHFVHDDIVMVLNAQIVK